MNKLSSDIAGIILDYGTAPPSYARTNSIFREASIPRTEKFKKNYPFWDLLAKNVLRGRYAGLIQFYLNRAAFEYDWILFMSFIKYYTSLSKKINKNIVISLGIEIAHEFARSDIVNKIIDKYGYPDSYTGSVFEWYKYQRDEIDVKTFVTKLYGYHHSIDWIGYIPIGVRDHILSSSEFQKRISECLESQLPSWQQREVDYSEQYHFECDLLYIIVGDQYMPGYILEENRLSLISQFFGQGDPRTITQLISSMPIKEIVNANDVWEYEQLLREPIEMAYSPVIVTPQISNKLKESFLPMNSYNPMYILYNQIGDIGLSPKEQVYGSIEMKIAIIIREKVDSNILDWLINQSSMDHKIVNISDLRDIARYSSDR